MDGFAGDNEAALCKAMEAYAKGEIEREALMPSFLKVFNWGEPLAPQPSA